RETEYIDAEEFIAVKGYRAKGKRLTTYEVKKTQFVEPLIKEEDIDEAEITDEEDVEIAELEEPKASEENDKTEEKSKTIELEITDTSAKEEKTTSKKQKKADKDDNAGQMSLDFE
ncbi:MAG: hypothetical protein GX879_07070, partial [Bacteroidales bacterium]|nr:hypothetical protein [Bacteroidales bacterium]